jgi:spermidine dehydrogenase
VSLKKTNEISRRDFLNGMALSLAAGTSLSPTQILAQSLGRELPYYPPGLTGMRGSHDGSFEVAHALAREGRTFSRPSEQTEDTYDLIVVGGGISGLSAAKFFRDRGERPSRILVLDNHDDFGGHARRNELDVDGKKLLCYGGSQSIDSPSSYSKVAKGLLKDLSIDPDRFYDYFDQDYFKSRGLKNGIFFDRKTYGVDHIQVNPLPGFLGDNLSGADLEAAVRSVPISEEDQGALIRLITGGVDYLDGMSREEKIELLRNTSYLAYLEKYAEMPKSVTGILQDTFLVMNAVGWEADSALSAARYYYPGTRELGIQEDEGEEEPYIFHFPDGNASVARALVRDLIPEAIPGDTMEDLVTAHADYSLLDSPDSDVRIRLSSTVVNALNTPDGRFVDVTYVKNGETYRARARHAVMACYNGIIPNICPEVPQQQVEAIRYATKIPFVVSSIAIRNWRAFADAGVSSVYTPGDVYFKRLFLDFPVSMGDYHYSKGPDEPVVVSGWFSPTTRGLPAKDQYRAGRAKLMQMSYDDFEQDIYSHFDAMLGPHGFDAEREIAAITLNRWPHGYAYEFEGVGVSAEYDRYNGPHIAGRAQLGRISIANSDSEAYAYVQGAIDAADRAVNEQIN